MRTFKNKKIQVGEKETQRAVIQYLETRKNFLVFWRNNTATIFVTQSNGKRGMIRSGTLGSPDIFVVKDGVTYGLEIKGSDENKSVQSDNQRVFQLWFEQCGGKYFIIRSIDEVMKML